MKHQEIKHEQEIKMDERIERITKHMRSARLDIEKNNILYGKSPKDPKKSMYNETMTNPNISKIVQNTPDTLEVTLKDNKTLKVKCQEIGTPADNSFDWIVYKE